MRQKNNINKVVVTLEYFENQYEVPNLSNEIVFYTTSSDDEEIKREAREKAGLHAHWCARCEADFLGVRQGVAREPEEDESPMPDDTFTYEVYPNCGLSEEQIQEYEQVTPLFVGLFLVEKDGKKGYVHPDGRVAVPCIADEVYMIFDGLAYFKSEGKYGFYSLVLDKYFEPIYDEADNEEWESPVSVVLNGERGYVTEEGKFISEEQFDNGEYDSVVCGTINA